MKVHIEMIPLKGIIINDSVEITFGQTLAEITSSMNQEGLCIRNKCYWYENSLCLEFEYDKLVFIEISKLDRITLDLLGKNPFTMTDDELIPYLCGKCNVCEEAQTEYKRLYDYVVKQKNISLYRGNTPCDILESIEEAKAEGYYREDMEKEYVESQYFEVIGIADVGYFDKTW